MKQIETLSREAEALRKKEIDGVVSRIKEAIDVYGLTASDLGLSGSGQARKGPAGKSAAKRRGRPGSKVKYRDEAGNVWGGRGPRPQWLRNALASGKKLEDFAA
jgi:DNA-binding protein H-NS